MAGVVLVVGFSASNSSSSSFGGYIDYISRDDAKDLEDDFLNSGYIDYMSNPEKTENLFTADKDNLSAVDKKFYKNTYNLAQENGSILWQPIISFDNDFLEENGLYNSHTKKLDEKKIMEYTRGCIQQMLKNENLDDTAIWTASIHYNTDNLHVHVAVTEPFPQREQVNRKYITLSKEFLEKNGIEIPSVKNKRENVYGDKANKELKDLYYNCKNVLGDVKLSSTVIINDNGTVRISVAKDNECPAPSGTTYTDNVEPKGKWKQSTINKGKSYYVNQILNSAEINKKINNIIREGIVNAKKENPIHKDDDLIKLFKEIHEKLPTDKRLWRYNMHEIEDVKPLIDKLSFEYINKYHQAEFLELEEELNNQEKKYTKAYGENTQNERKANKINDLYERLGNSILNELRNYDKELKATQNERSEGEKATSGTGNLFELDYAMRKLKNLLRKDFSHTKNQLDYEKLQKQIQQNYDYDEI